MKTQKKSCSGLTGQQWNGTLGRSCDYSVSGFIVTESAHSKSPYGEGDLVVTDIGTYSRREKMLKLREELLDVQEDGMRGSKGYSAREVAAMMRNAIKEAAGHGTAEQIPCYRVRAGNADACFPCRVFGTGQSRSCGAAGVLFSCLSMIPERMDFGRVSRCIARQAERDTGPWIKQR